MDKNVSSIFLLKNINGFKVVHTLILEWWSIILNCDYSRSYGVTYAASFDTTIIQTNVADICGHNYSCDVVAETIH